MLDKNLKYLRQKNKISQQGLSEALDIPRTTLGDYERGKTEPNIAMLIKMATYFDVKVDELVKEDLSHSDYEVLKTKVMRVLAISVDSENEGNIELVDTKAEAGYLESFQNPEYIRDLPKIQFPNIPSGTYRGFEIQGESMLPAEPGSIIIASYIEDLSYIKDNKTYIIISKRDGLVYKRVKLNKDKNQLILISDNEVFLPYELDYEQVEEVWEYYAHLSFSDVKKTVPSKLEVQMQDLQKRIMDIQKTIN